MMGDMQIDQYITEIQQQIDEYDKQLKRKQKELEDSIKEPGIFTSKLLAEGQILDAKINGLSYALYTFKDIINT